MNEYFGLFRFNINFTVIVGDFRGKETVMISGISSNKMSDLFSLSQLWQNMFNKIDTNSDGSIDKTELQAAAPKKSFGMNEILNSGTNQNAVISTDETNTDSANFEQYTGVNDFAMNMGRIGGPPPPPMNIQDGEESSNDLFSLLDSNGDGMIDQTELQAFGDQTGIDTNTIFSAIDTDGDDLISQSEFDTFLNSIREQIQEGFSPDGFQNAPKLPDIDTIFSGIDTDGDGLISQSEFVASLESMQEQVQENFSPDSFQNAPQLPDINTIFSGIDTNSDGLISQSEYVASLTSIREQLLGSLLSDITQNTSKESDVDTIFNGIDTDGDGLISQSEFKTYMATMREEMHLQLFNSISGNDSDSQYKNKMLTELLKVYYSNGYESTNSLDISL